MAIVIVGLLVAGIVWLWFRLRIIEVDRKILTIEEELLKLKIRELEFKQRERGGQG
jgi:uncharacterized membrane protein YciS (DUF1049 family)